MPFPVLEGQSIGIVPPGTDASGRPHHARQYSVASPRNGERPGYNNLSLTVKRVLEDHQGRPVRGVASNYLCDLQVGDKVQVIGPFGTSFLMPNHPKSHIVMICTGTGSAPMRAMTEWRRRLRQSGKFEGGKLMLFFGARTQEELPYFGPLQNLPKDFIDINFAFSRTPGAAQALRAGPDARARRRPGPAAGRPQRVLLRLRPEGDGRRRGAGAARRGAAGRPGLGRRRRGAASAKAACTWRPTDARNPGDHAAPPRRGAADDGAPGGVQRLRRDDDRRARRGVCPVGRRPGVRVIVLAGDGKHFSAGADLQWMQRASTASRDWNLDDARRFAAMLSRIDTCPKPTVARIQGAALGGGVGLAAACDIAIAADNASFAVSEAKFGILPSVIGPYLVNAVGKRQARRLALTAERIGAAEALAIGLVQQVQPMEALDAAVDATLAQLLAGGPAAQAEIKHYLAQLEPGPVTAEVIERTAQTIARVRGTDEAREGFAAFLAKRPPTWTPQ